MRPTRRIIIAIGSTLAVAALNAPTASAAPPAREVIPVQSDAIYTNLCAFPLRVQDQGTFIVQTFTDATGFVVRTTTTIPHYRAVLTNQATGYSMNGLALTIIVGQLPKLLGFSVDADGLVAEARAFVSGLAQGDANATAAVVGVASLAGILLLNRLLPKLPSVLIVVVLAAAAVNALDLQEHGVDTIGVIPQGFPPFTVPDRKSVV